MSRAYATAAAVYRMYNAAGDLLYIGCSPDPCGRWQEHSKFKPWGRTVTTISVEWFDSKAEALEAEKAAIQAEAPEWNIHHNAQRKRSIGVFHPQFNPADPASWVVA